MTFSDEKGMTSYYKLIRAGIDVQTDIEENKSMIFRIDHPLVVSFMKYVVHKKAYHLFSELQKSKGEEREGEERRIINDSDPISLSPVCEIPSLCKWDVEGPHGRWVFDIRNASHLLKCNPYTRETLSEPEKEVLLLLLDQLRILGVGAEESGS